MNMIEKVAKAIADKVMGEQSITDNCHTAAKAAIEAMREPTEEMIKPFLYTAYDEYIKKCWNDAIDAALEIDKEEE